MVAIDREPGGSTMIRVSYEVKKMIEEEKIIPREPLNDCIKRGILENRESRKRHPSIETKQSLEIDLKTAIDKNVPGIGPIDNAHSIIWLYYHPEDPILEDELIHHINGNHNDNRIENLKKIKRANHGVEHSDLRKDFPYNGNGNDKNKVVGKNI